MHEVGVGASAILCTHVQPPPKPVTHSRRAHACTLAYTGRDKACTLDEPWIRTCVRACATNAPCAPGSHAMHHRCYRPTIFRIFTFTQSSSSFSFFTVSRLLIYISFFLQFFRIIELRWIIDFERSCSREYLENWKVFNYIIFSFGECDLWEFVVSRNGYSSRRKWKISKEVG